ncbi:MAG: bifunctional 23S rRNA (guanine(2069)-N(7))-methyltransferase RlmK/23S rRNA (guanine(2445)-N(2))-methyltransferase RlmL [Planctomycetia bacterium]|nr:bifunctional 23S rRNA (guanine(2069)-N(7))-methyltransferase RlmK/23S rRNA (guanine(2445)-N(2))-methyltransferase RlmL [Planctomycetia bacterium]
MNDISLIATSTMGLEALVFRELEQLGFTPQNIETGRTLFTGSEIDICRANTHLRTAGRVLIQMGTFEAVDFGQLFDGVVALPWERWLPRNAAFPVDGRSVKSQLANIPTCQKIVKKAIASRLQKVYGRFLPEDGGTFPIEVSLLKDTATLTIDTSGNGLHRRGYKKLVGKAPLRETIAAALVLLSYWNPERQLIDPFCGSGTIPIEAALIGRNIAPGLRRHFVSEYWDTLPQRAWRETRKQAKDAILPPLQTKILGYDLDPESIEMARYHATLAGVADDIVFEKQDFLDLQSDALYGCLITNPPYGKWIGEWHDLEELYAHIPRVLRRLPTWSHYIYTAFPHLERFLGKEAPRRRKIYNSRLECTYYQFPGPKPGTEIPQPETPAQPKIAFASEGDFVNRLKKLAHHLRRYPQRGITCYRIYDRDIPEIPLAIDRYDDCLHIAEYERPHDRTPTQHADWLEQMVTLAGQTLDVPRNQIFLKTRRRQRGTSQYDRYDNRHYVRTVEEGGLKFLVNLSDYLDTGLFLDHRNTREMVRREAKEKHFLNLFAYTGSFSVYAAAGEARTVTTVDLSNTYLDWAAENMERNGFGPDPRYQYVKSDVRRFLQTLYDHEIFDLAVLDPPTFSNSKDLAVWDVQRDHADVLNLLLPHISPGGVVYFSTNHRKFKFHQDALPNATAREITHRTVPDDFRNKKIHRCWRIVKNA